MKLVKLVVICSILAIVASAFAKDKEKPKPKVDIIFDGDYTLE